MTGAAISTPAPPAGERLAALDIARGISLMCMVTVHVLDQLCDPEIQSTSLGTAMYMPGRLFDAPVFLFIMGASLAFSRRTGVKEGLIRGFKLFLLGYALNLVRGTIPMYLGMKWGLVPLGDMKPSDSPLSLFFEVDLLQFAGLALILLAVLNRYARRPVHWLIFALLIQFFPRSLAGATTDNALVDFFLNLLWGVSDTTHYPLLPWLAYPLFGKVYGHYLAAARDKGTYFLRTASLGLLLLIGCTPVLFEDPALQAECFQRTLYGFKSTPFGILWHIGLIAVLIGICHRLSANRTDSPFLRKLEFWSRHVTVFYCVQWTLIGWLVIALSDIGKLEGAVFMAFVIFTTDLAVKGWDRLTTARPLPPAGA